MTMSETQRILIIDDEEIIRDAFTLALEDSGYLVDTAETGDRGLQMAHSVPYDLILLDLKMPGMSGITVLRKLRDMNGSVPIYIVTAFQREFFEQLQSIEEEGIAFELIRKPLSREQIIMVVQSILASPQKVLQ
jgi:CheY-like chemotaxis protein